MAQAPPVVLTIAGFDPSSGAGVTADIKTIAAHGCYGVACITALTVQSTAGVRRVETMNAELISETLDELCDDFQIGAVHIGMLGSAKVVRAVANFLDKKKLENVVLDPILKSTSGAELI
ncbi:MAG TPA: bifunctional hydroxymethylpyrimidine kinase/phosphomethylpyrimidine kinase, partial [Terriglobales bacterium]|nr:bifunctional hydroxymethylpyrimidine kinase/phosphomethylpyrimidine kinase [Terriglobales bacterium]